ncbi:hypothetical protein PR048_024820 [Dryococelus australis]|uniref:DUF4371 domain-containing protein n=1 Tax=Dryococelus australis TaxID=614101 RepID=A0ABQ9GPM5_9NEOP|nr:hypothetical protein PR048_024820 [Dryococelus australis]
MADETKDVSKVEQLAILISYVDCEDWKIKERVIGVHNLKDCSAENIANAIFSLLSEQGLDLKYYIGQYCDGANVMSGWENGFSEDQGDIMEATKALKMTEVSFFDGQVLKPLVNKYQDFINVDLLEKQLPLGRNFLQLHGGLTTPIEYPQNLQKLPMAYSEIFSVLKRVKNYLRSTCSDDRLSSLMILAVEQEEVKKISLDELVNDFARMKERRYPLLH